MAGRATIWPQKRPLARLGRPAVAIRGVGFSTPSWLLFRDPNETRLRLGENLAQADPAMDPGRPPHDQEVSRRTKTRRVLRKPTAAPGARKVPRLFLAEGTVRMVTTHHLKVCEALLPFLSQNVPWAVTLKETLPGKMGAIRSGGGPRIIELEGHVPGLKAVFLLQKEQGLVLICFHCAPRSKGKLPDGLCTRILSSSSACRVYRLCASRHVGTEDKTRDSFLDLLGPLAYSECDLGEGETTRQAPSRHQQ